MLYLLLDLITRPQMPTADYFPLIVKKHICASWRVKCSNDIVFFLQRPNYHVYLHSSIIVILPSEQQSGLINALGYFT